VYRTIIVGFDGSDHARYALALARLLSGVTGARLIAGSVYDSGPWMRAAYRSEWREEMRRIAEEALAEVGEEAERVTVDRSSAARGLHDLAEHEDADLIVVGSSHRGRVGRVLAGSVAERLLHGAPCGVAIAPAGYVARETGGLDVVAVGYDGSPESKVALAGAGELAGAARASVRILAVVEPPKPPRAPTGAVHAGAEEILATIRRALEAVVDEALTEVPPGVDASAEVITGVTDLLGEQEGVDRLVVGSRGYGPLRRTLLGSTSLTLVRHARYRLIVFPRGAHPPHDDDRSAAGAARAGNAR
jgi:nucleotide-binding universal stress UspA family protein